MDMYARYSARARTGPEGGGRRRSASSRCGSQDVFRYCQKQGYDRGIQRGGGDLHRAVVRRLHQRRPGVSRKPTDVTISAINRNFPGRSGPGQLYLASPCSVAAVASAGRIVALGVPSKLGAHRAGV